MPRHDAAPCIACDVSQALSLGLTCSHLQCCRSQHASSCVRRLQDQSTNIVSVLLYQTRESEEVALGVEVEGEAFVGASF